MSSKREQRSSTLRYIRNDHSELPTPGLRLTRESQRSLPITPQSPKQHMQILIRVSVEQGLLEQRDAVGHQLIDQHN